MNKLCNFSSKMLSSKQLAPIALKLGHSVYIQNNLFIMGILTQFEYISRRENTDSYVSC